MSSSLLASLKKRLQERDVNSNVLFIVPPDPACMVTHSWTQKDNNNCCINLNIVKVFHRKTSATISKENSVIRPDGGEVFRLSGLAATMIAAR